MTRALSHGACHLFYVAGYLALALTEMFHPALMVLWGAVLLASWRWRHPDRRFAAARIRLGFLGLLPLAAIDGSTSMAVGGPDLFAALVSWGGLFLMLWPFERAPHGLSCLFTLGQLVAAGTLSTSIWFALSTAAFVASGVSMLICLTLADGRSPLLARHPIPFVKIVLDPTPVSDRAALRGPPPRPVRLVMAVSMAITATTVLLFLIIPRYGAGWFFSSRREPIRRAGFSERVTFGAIGEMQNDDTVVMRVKLMERTGRYPGYLRWRGVGLDHFDGRAWTESPGREWVLESRHRGLRDTRYVVGASLEPDVVILKQRVFLDSDLEGVIFAAPRLLQIWGQFTRLVRSRNGSVTMKLPAFTTRSYLVSSAVNDPDAAALIASEGVEENQDMDVYRQLPAVIGPRVRELASKIVGPARTRYEKAAVIERYLRSRYTYQVKALEPADPGNPIEWFLFDFRKGHCEYFAGAMAVLLRSLDIPCRVVNGFVQGGFNPVGDYYLVRANDAHSWVEVHYPQIGWVTYDASPDRLEPAPTRSGQLARTLGLYLDALSMSWRLHVVDYHLLDQVAYVRAMLAFLRGRPGASPDRTGSTSTLSGQDVPKVFLLICGLLVAMSMSWMIVRRAMRTGPLHGTEFPTRAYLDMLRSLERRGIARDPHETPREIVRRVRSRWPPALQAVETLTDWFEQARYGGRTVTASGRAAIERALAELRTMSRARDGSGAPDPAAGGSGRLPGLGER